jgi:hypothetical protein
MCKEQQQQQMNDCAKNEVNKYASQPKEETAI